MQTDYDRLKAEENDKSTKLKELILMNERRERVSRFEKSKEQKLIEKVFTFSNGWTC